MSSPTLLDNGGLDPFVGARVVVLNGERAGEVATLLGVHEYYTAYFGIEVYRFLSCDGERMVGGRESFEVSPYQGEKLEDVPNV